MLAPKEGGIKCDASGALIAADSDPGDGGPCACAHVFHPPLTPYY